MTPVRAQVAFLLVLAGLSGCIPATSVTFFITQRTDPLSDVTALEQLCRDLGLTRMDAVGPPQPPKGQFVCESRPRRGYFIVFTPETDKRQIEVYFAEAAESFSPDTKAAYSEFVRRLKGQFGDAAAVAPTI